jgi:hypothetical protein
MSVSGSAGASMSKYAFVGGATITTLGAPSEWPMYAVIFAGLVSGSIVSWGWSKATGRALDRHWLVLQVAFYPGALSGLIWAQEYAGLTIKSVGWLATIAAFLSYDGATALRARLLKTVEGGET